MISSWSSFRSNRSGQVAVNWAARRTDDNVDAGEVVVLRLYQFAAKSPLARAVNKNNKDHLFRALVAPVQGSATLVMPLVLVQLAALRSVHTMPLDRFQVLARSAASIVAQLDAALEEVMNPEGSDESSSAASTESPDERDRDGDRRRGVQPARGAVDVRPAPKPRTPALSADSRTTRSTTAGTLPASILHPNGLLAMEEKTTPKRIANPPAVGAKKSAKAAPAAAKAGAVSGKGTKRTSSVSPTRSQSPTAANKSNFIFIDSYIYIFYFYIYLCIYFIIIFFMYL